MKLQKRIMAGFYLVMGVALLITNGVLKDNVLIYVPYIVSVAIMLHGVTELIEIGLTKSRRKYFGNYLYNVFVIILALFTFLIDFLIQSEYAIFIACVIWAVWSLLKEGYDLQFHIFKEVKNKWLLILNIVFGIVILVFSGAMLIDPLGHAHTHVILLGVEWIIESFNSALIAATIGVDEKES